jgi:hypothetical protein
MSLRLPYEFCFSFSIIHTNILRIHKIYVTYTVKKLNGLRHTTVRRNKDHTNLLKKKKKNAHRKRFLVIIFRCYY